jgi:hypothetical protein
MISRGARIKLNKIQVVLRTICNNNYICMGTFHAFSLQNLSRSFEGIVNSFKIYVEKTKF